MKYYVYKAYYINSKSKFASFIRMQQRLQGIPYPFRDYSHEEIVFGATEDPSVLQKIYSIKEIYGKSNMNIKNDSRRDYFKTRGLWFSSSESDGGCRFKFIQDNKDNWDFFKIEVSRDQYIQALDFAIGFTHPKKYTYAWTKIVFTQAFKTLWFIDRATFFCSEICSIISQSFFGMFPGKNSIRINPGNSAWMTDRNHQDKGMWEKNIT